MNLFLLLWMLQQVPAKQSAPLWEKTLDALDRSGRAVEIITPAKERLEPPPLAPGLPPLLSFRYFEGQARHRFGELGLLIDDAGH